MKARAFATLALLATTAAFTPSVATAQAFSNLFVFGDSYADAGNVGIGLGAPQGVAQVVSNSYIPAAPYPTNGTYFPAVFSNGPVWASRFAQQLGLSAGPSLGPAIGLSAGTNYAFGGARTTTDTDVPSVRSQVGMFLGAHGGVAPSSALYVVEDIGNDTRDALAAILGGANPLTTAQDTAATYASNMGGIVDTLQAAGATHILVFGAANVGLAPAITAAGPVASGLASFISQAMNVALAQRLAGEAGVERFDSYAFITDLVEHPGAHGFSNATDACGAAAAGTDCSGYFFWDGLHATAAGHQAIANAVFAQVVPEPETLALMAFGLLAVGFVTRRRARAA
jgi:outer membrane lipase/esterase